MRLDEAVYLVYATLLSWCAISLGASGEGAVPSAKRIRQNTLYDYFGSTKAEEQKEASASDDSIADGGYSQCSMHILFRSVHCPSLFRVPLSGLCVQLFCVHLSQCFSLRATLGSWQREPFVDTL